MQTGLSRLQRRYLCQNFDSILVTRSRCFQRGHQRRCSAVCWVTHGILPRQSFHSSTRSFANHVYNSEPVPFADTESSNEPPNSAVNSTPRSKKRKPPRIPSENIRDPKVWIDLLDLYLPKELRARASLSAEEVKRSDDHVQDQEQVCQEIVAILESARREQHAGRELLTYMVINGREDAALHIVSRLLHDIASRYPSRNQKLTPSNVRWSRKPMDIICSRPIELKPTNVQSTQLIKNWHVRFDDPRYSFIPSDKKEVTMTEIWSMLGTLIVEAAELSATKASVANNVVSLVLGQIHNLDLVPENVYAYNPSPLSTTIVRPPILHLVSSRILTTISDATWRQQQDEMIKKAADHGISYEEIGRDPPGGRFRLKVRPLGPEVWLEFVLWCCVEGGFASAGMRIIRTMRAQNENPWFAITWSPRSGSGQTSPTIDWQRVRERYGGSVGSKEGYSDEKPFVEMPSRTISTEVVLALVDTSINSTNHALMRGGAVQTIQRNISELIAFLEPHDLPVGYFNYLSVRLMQAEVFDLPEHSQTLHTWYKRLASMRSLQTAQVRSDAEPALNLNAISAYSEVFASILHQALDGCVQNGDIHRALDIFNLLQESVDTSKLQAIGCFLSETAAMGPSTLWTSGLPPGGNLMEFVRSHGQLPTYKLIGLFNLSTDTGLIGFGQWLLYNDGPDGALIPRSTYQNSGLAQSLLRFATLSQDADLLNKILTPRKGQKRMFSVSLVRALVNANLTLLQFGQAYRHLSSLRNAQGGGVGLANIAQLAALIFKLETSQSYDLTSAGKAHTLSRAQTLLERMLAGNFDNKVGGFQRTVRKQFRQQVGAMLQVFAIYSNSILSEVGTQYAGKYPSANTAHLAPAIFNHFLETVVQCKGSVEGMRLWNLCCQPPGSAYNQFSDDHLLLDEDDDDSNGVGQQDTEAWGESEGLQADLAPKNMVNEHNREVGSAPDGTLGQMPPPRDVTTYHRDLFNPDDLSNSFFPETTTTESMSANERIQLVRPNQQTLRIIIREAIRERQEILQFKGNVDVQRTVLAWAAEELKRFGATPRMISIELDEPQKQSQSLKHDSRRFKSTPYQAASPAKIRRVSSSFDGREKTRLHETFDST